MAVFTTHSLYPGTIDTAMPGFIVDGDNPQTKVYFDFSQYNQPTDIKQNYIQVSLRYQNNNLNALDDASGIVLKGWSNDNDGKGYYFILNTDDLAPNINKYSLTMDTAFIQNKDYFQYEAGTSSYVLYEDTRSGNPHTLGLYEHPKEFLPYQYYKLQFRLTDAAASAKTSGQTIDNWLSADSGTAGKTNLDESSEWSTICLIRGITTMNLDVIGWSEAETTIEVPDSWEKIVGRIGFVEAENGAICTEYLKATRIKLYDKSNVLVRDSGYIYSSQYEDYNQFSYLFDYNFETGSTNVYTVEITCITNTLYQETNTYNFYVSESNPEITFNPTFTADANEEEGIIRLMLEFDEFPQNANAIAFYRASSLDNYTRVEKIYQKAVTAGSSMSVDGIYPFMNDTEDSIDRPEIVPAEDEDGIFYDISAESGILYKYYVRALNTTNNKQSAKTALESPVGVTLNHMFLDQGSRQLKIKFNPNVNSMRTNYLESKIDTLGSRYPFIKRNGAVKYRSFSISGLVSYFMDDENMFTSRTYELGEDNIDDYNDFNNINNIKPRNDYTYERIFRERVKEFLENGDIKLFRSPTEGNILVRLMDVNFSPIQTNGRLVWDFNATAYEIAEPTIDNFNKYGIKMIYTKDDFLGNNDYEDETSLYSLMAAWLNGALGRSF